VKDLTPIYFNPLNTEFLLHKIQFVPHKKHSTSPLQRPTG
jgi:hypothetical protein